MTTRAVILQRAFARIGIADYVFDVEPDERAEARLTLDGMMSEWDAAGVALGYTPSGGADNDAVMMTTPAWADAVIWNNLAVRLAPDYGKTILVDLRRDARRGYDLAVSKTIVIPVERRATPRVVGGGARYYRRFGF